MNVRPILVGELGLLSLFDLVQLLMLNGATGMLRVASAGRQGHFRFERGQVAGALDDLGPDGLESAYRLFTWRTGTFAFSVGTPGGGRTIEDSTEGVMLEAARRLDESGAAVASPFHTTTLQARMQAMAAWRGSLARVAPGLAAPEPVAGPPEAEEPAEPAGPATAEEAPVASVPDIQPVTAPKRRRRARRRFRDAA